MHDFPLFSKPTFINLRGQLFDINQPKVMGILNITPDSFYDGGKYSTESEQLKQVEKMITEGADFIDIGAQSTRPGAKMLDQKSEEKILLPVLQKLVKIFPHTHFSIDTFYAEVAKNCVHEGADLINDISAGTFDPDMLETMAKLNVPYIIMHTPTTPDKMQNATQYNHVLKDVIYWLSERLNLINQLGINDVIIDPGFGFGKTMEQNYQLLKNLNHFKFLQAPILVGLSRKSLIYKALKLTPEEALNGTTALHVLALQNGAGILRVHDVKEAVETIHLKAWLDQA
jgi:dihydropteroate synthase